MPPETERPHPAIEPLQGGIVGRRCDEGDQDCRRRRYQRHDAETDPLALRVGAQIVEQQRCGDQRYPHGGQFRIEIDALPEPAKYQHRAHPGAEQQGYEPCGLDRAQVGHDDHRDHQDQHVGQPRDQDQLAILRLALEHVRRHDAGIDIVAPVRGAPVEVGVDRGSQRRQQAHQHQAPHARRQQFLDALDEQRLTAGGKARAFHLGRREGIQHQQADGDRHPEQAAQQYLQPGEYQTRHPGVPIGRTGHASLCEITGAVGIHLKEPLQADDHEKGHQGVTGIGRRGERQHLARLLDTVQLDDTIGQAAQPACRIDDEPGISEGADHRQAELNHVGLHHGPQPAGYGVHGRKCQDQQDRDQIVGTHHRRFEPGDAFAQLNAGRGDEPHDGLVNARRQPVVPWQKHFGDTDRSHQHHRQHHAVDHRSVIDRLEQTQRRDAGPAVAYSGQFGIGQYAGTAPAHREDEGHEQESQAIDPQAPEREDAGGGNQARDQQRRIRRELRCCHGESGFPAFDGLAGEKVLIEALRGLVPGT